MADTYAILGFADDMETPVNLCEFDTYTEADDWVTGYTRWGDWGGYDTLALYEVSPTETADSIHLTDQPITTWERETA